MSSTFFKHLPWIAPTAAVLVVGLGFQGEIRKLVSNSTEPVATAPQGGDNEAALAALAAVEPAPAPGQSDVAAQLAALLNDAPAAAPAPAADVEVTRSQGFSMDTLQQATEQATDVAMAAQPEAEAPVASTGPVTTDFFAAAQASLSHDQQCIDELKGLAAQARVYFPSGGLNADAAGIEQARLLGLLAHHCPGVAIQVVGHSDPSGDPVLNQQLSLERAEAVITRVVASGVESYLFSAVGMGSQEPSAVTGPETAAYYDRRVEFIVVETAQNASFVAPNGGTSAPVAVQTAACVQELRAAVVDASIEYAPHGLVVDGADLALAAELAGIAANCPQARLRLIGQHSDDPLAREDASTGRLRAVVLMTRLVNAGYPAEELILAAPSDARPAAGLSDSRVDFDVILEDL